MGKIITIGNFKGGVGKTTIATALVSEYQRRGISVLLADGDPQRTAMMWASVEGGDQPSVIGLTEQTPIRDVGSKFERVLIDCPPAHPGAPGEQEKSPAARAMAAALLSSDLVVLPVTPGPADLWALGDAISLVGRARIKRKKLRAVVLVNRRKPRARLDVEVRESLADCGEPLLETMLSDLVAYRESFLAGKGPSSWEDGKAKDEVIRLADELEKLLR